MLYISEQNELSKWRRFYLFLQYFMVHMYYGAHQFLINKFTIDRMIKGTEYQQYKAIMVK